MKMEKKSLSVICILIGLCVIFWILSIIHCEVLTLQRSAEFENLWQENTMLSEPDSIKVLEYSDTYAKIYHRSIEGGATLEFSRTDSQSEWEFLYWDTIWSRSGSADGFIWPYIR